MENIYVRVLVRLDWNGRDPQNLTIYQLGIAIKQENFVLQSHHPERRGRKRKTKLDLDFLIHTMP